MLVYERYALCMPEGLIEAVFDTLVGTTELENGGYVDLLEDGDAWIVSPAYTGLMKRRLSIP